MSKKTGYITGGILLGVGIVLAIIGFLIFLKSPGDIMDPNSTFFKVGIGSALIFLGFLIAGAGGIILYLSSIGKIFSYMAKETAPGIETTTHAVGKGLASGVKKGWTENTEKE
ncbi:MAG: hypothetical protein ABIH59_03280 [archaeon]